MVCLVIASTILFQRGGPLYIALAHPAPAILVHPCTSSPVLPPPSDRSIPYLASIAAAQTGIHALRPLSHVVWDRQCTRQVLSLKANVKMVIGAVLLNALL